MDIVRIKLIKPNSFWFLNDLHLGPGNTLSPPFDLEAADPKIKEKITKAESNFGIIKIIRQPKDTVPAININTDSTKRFELPQTTPMAIKISEEKKVVVPLSPPPETANVMPELKSFTTEPEPEPEEEAPAPSDKDYEEAKALLSRNGNTIKKTIRFLNREPKEKQTFLLACIEIEMKGKNRDGILESLKNALSEATK